MKKILTFCDSCKVEFEPDSRAGHFKYRIKNGWLNFLGEWMWANVDICPDCFVGFKAIVQGYRMQNEKPPEPSPENV